MREKEGQFAKGVVYIDGKMLPPPLSWALGEWRVGGDASAANLGGWECNPLAAGQRVESLRNGDAVRKW